MRHFETDTHALRTGMLLGALMKAGITANPEVDAGGNYTDVLVLTFDDGFEIAVQVLPPEPGQET